MINAVIAMLQSLLIKSLFHFRNRIGQEEIRVARSGAKRCGALRRIALHHIVISNILACCFFWLVIVVTITRLLLFLVAFAFAVPAVATACLI